MPRGHWHGSQSLARKCGALHDANGKVQSCELRNDSAAGAGWDVMLLENGEPLFSRRCVDERGARFVEGCVDCGYAVGKNAAGTDTTALAMSFTTPNQDFVVPQIDLDIQNLVFENGTNQVGVSLDTSVGGTPVRLSGRGH